MRAGVRVGGRGRVRAGGGARGRGGGRGRGRRRREEEEARVGLDRLSTKDESNTLLPGERQVHSGPTVGEGLARGLDKLRHPNFGNISKREARRTNDQQIDRTKP